MTWSAVLKWMLACFEAAELEGYHIFRRPGRPVAAQRSSASSSAACGSQGDFDGNRHEVELSSLPQSRTPSYISRCSFSKGDNRADEALLPDRGSKHAENTIKAVTQTSKSVRNRLKRHRLQGWRFGVTVSAWTAFTVLLLNLILTIYAGVRYPHHGGLGIAFEGKSSTVNSWATWLHVLINGLSSILLSASNYTMQCLCSPTRKEVDQAHARGDWLDIGVPSVRNIWRIDWRRSVLWWLLALSAIPIHLLYNSAIFKSLAANEYYMLVINEHFLQGKISGNWSESLGLSTTSLIEAEAVQRMFTENRAYMNDAMVHNLTNNDCMQAYGSSFVSDYLSLLAITSAQANYTVFHTDAVYYGVDITDNSLPYYWICLDMAGATNPFRACDLGKALRAADGWTIAGQKIDYCLAAVSEPHCQLQFSIQILATVIVMNACKCISLVTAGALLGIGVQKLSQFTSSSDAFSMGFGSVDARALIDAGLPQSGSSGLQIRTDGKEEATASDDSSWATTYSIPLIVASATLHWLISQSIFLARVSVYDSRGNYDGEDHSEVGYSCLPILLAILLGTAMLLAAVGSGFRKSASHIPVAGSCSVALAAAAHRPKSDIDAAFLPVQWGEVNSEGTDEVGHCCFTSKEVRDLMEGRMYAGSAVTTGIDSSDTELMRERNCS
ncbi:hypothetical protein D0862_07171 [Hortaea werneckii]|uniref:DUF6536 domain-containing protein n=1 Tax=Hortaea werneckii TaxID=91943 RepID=A0A3M7GEU4_HORWE|nr:hypothetical protein D0862_07171 [Hortaea werneckii]